MSKIVIEGNLAYKLQPEITEEINPLAPDPLEYTSVALSEVFANNHRLEASAFNLKAKAAKYKVEHCRYGYVHLWGEGGLVKEASYPGRFKRIYVEKGNGIPFFLPSQLGEIQPKPSKYISEKTYTSIKGVEIKPNSLLLSRSGTIGKCAISSKTTIGKVYSDDVIRVSLNSDFDLGYVYAYLCTTIGQQMLQTNNYGAVIQHIEPEHLKNIIIPNAPDSIKKRIHSLVVESYDLRDQSNELIDEAERILYAELQLPPIEQLKPKYFDENVALRNYTTKLSELNLRLDCSYHTPEILKAKEIINTNCKELVPLMDGYLSDNIFTGNRFTRVFVDSRNGVPYLNGKQILELDPNGFDKKYLSFEQHEERIKRQLEIKENTIIVTCSGTIGKTVLVPKHWVGWVGTHDLIRIESSNLNTIGYVYCWLNSDYGQLVIKSLTYGSVVDHIEAFHIANMKMPLLKNESKQKEINDKVLQANDLRYQAYLKEQEAIIFMEEIINK